ncbi:HNH endonuclease [Nocardioides albidus]|uniref:HNH endonuclease n=1 Tax=Nocardioides albidus TaxID=1517589 RepID=A0A5C4VNZ8_9ACTN|nr:HNH endonuclease signature motif containing protein [Nocardioides albidus]TNM37570.1 HNH endonuclease [Nocardioides albidus]
MPARRRRWSDEELEAAVAASFSLAQVIGRLGLRVAGGNYATVRGAIARAGLDTSHFGGQGWSKGVVRGPRRSLDDYLSNRFPIGSYPLKVRLLSEGIFEARCNKCGGTEWLGQPMPLELEHRDGNSNNNALENLELLCPNCHAQTPTYRSRNRKRA